MGGGDAALGDQEPAFLFFCELEEQTRPDSQKSEQGGTEAASESPAVTGQIFFRAPLG